MSTLKGEWGQPRARAATNPASRCYDRIGRLALTITIFLWMSVVIPAAVFVAVTLGTVAVAALGSAVGR